LEVFFLDNNIGKEITLRALVAWWAFSARRPGLATVALVASLALHSRASYRARESRLSLETTLARPAG